MQRKLCGKNPMLLNGSFEKWRAMRVKSCQNSERSSKRTRCSLICSKKLQMSFSNSK